jgi:hypothetical protein
MKKTGFVAGFFMSRDGRYDENAGSVFSSMSRDGRYGDLGEMPKPLALAAENAGSVFSSIPIISRLFP